jgi:hypothetical protein
MASQGKLSEVHSVFLGYYKVGCILVLRSYLLILQQRPQPVATIGPGERPRAIPFFPGLSCQRFGQCRAIRLVRVDLSNQQKAYLLSYLDRVNYKMHSHGLSKILSAIRRHQASSFHSMPDSTRWATTSARKNADDPSDYSEMRVFRILESTTPLHLWKLEPGRY